MMKTRVRWTDLFTELMMGLFVVASILRLSGAFSSVCSEHSFLSPMKNLFISLSPPVLAAIWVTGSRCGGPETQTCSITC